MMKNEAAAGSPQTATPGPNAAIGKAAYDNAMEHYRARRYAPASAEFRRAIAHGEDDVAVKELLGNALRMCNSLEEALAVYLDVIAVKPDARRSLAHGARLAARLGRTDALHQLATSLLSLESLSSDELMAAALVLPTSAQHSRNAFYLTRLHKVADPLLIVAACLEDAEAGVPSLLASMVLNTYPQNMPRSALAWLELTPTDCVQFAERWAVWAMASAASFKAYLSCLTLLGESLSTDDRPAYLAALSAVALPKFDLFSRLALLGQLAARLKNDEWFSLLRSDALRTCQNRDELVAFFCAAKFLVGRGIAFGASSLAKTIRARITAELPEVSRLMHGTSAADMPPLQRLLILVPTLASKTSSFTRIVLDYAVALAESRPEMAVRLIVTDELAINSVAASGWVPESQLFKSAHGEILREYAGTSGATVAIEYLGGCAQNDHAGRVAAAVQAAEPDVVVAFHGISSLFLEWVGHNYPFLYMQTNRDDRPDVTADVYLANGDEVDFASIGVINPQRWRSHKIGFRPFVSTLDYTRADIGVPVESILLITVGNRLDVELSVPYIEQVDEVLLANPQCLWVVVGFKDSAARRKLFESVQATKQIIFREFEPDLRAMYRVSDIYLNPRRSGGGTSIALAVAEKLPVVTFTGSDANNFLPGQVTFDTDERYFAFVNDLIGSRARREQIGEECQREQSEGHSISAAARDFLGRCNEARISFGNRATRFPE